MLLAVAGEGAGGVEGRRGDEGGVLDGGGLLGEGDVEGVASAGEDETPALLAGGKGIDNFFPFTRDEDGPLEGGFDAETRVGGIGQRTLSGDGAAEEVAERETKVRDVEKRETVAHVNVRFALVAGHVLEGLGFRDGVGFALQRAVDVEDDVDGLFELQHAFSGLIADRADVDGHTLVLRIEDFMTIKQTRNPRLPFTRQEL